MREVCRHRGFHPDSPLAGEEWLSGPMVTAQTLRLYAHSLSRDARPHPQRLRVTDEGQTVAKVFPTNLVDRFLCYDCDVALPLAWQPWPGAASGVDPSAAAEARGEVRAGLRF